MNCIHGAEFCVIPSECPCACGHCGSQKRAGNARPKPKPKGGGR